MKRYLRRCEALEKILGAANDAVVADRLAHKLVTAGRPELSKPAGAVERWNKLRARHALKDLQAAMGYFRNASVFW